MILAPALPPGIDTDWLLENRSRQPSSIERCPARGVATRFAADERTERSIARSEFITGDQAETGSDHTTATRYVTCVVSYSDVTFYRGGDC